MRASIRAVKDRFSEFVCLARRGEEIIVTSHDKPVAKLVPVSPDDVERATGRKALLDELEELRESLPAHCSGPPLSRTVIDLRKEARY